jgi:hypothetical protein
MCDRGIHREFFHIFKDSSNSNVRFILLANHHFCSNCGTETSKGKGAFVAVKRKLMSENPDLVAAGKSISLAQLGGTKFLSSPKREPVKTRRVVVMPAKPLPSDEFLEDEDEVLRLVNLENSAEGTTEDNVDEESKEPANDSDHEER